MKKTLFILAFLMISISYLHSQTIVGKREVTSKNEVKKAGSETIESDKESKLFL